MKTMTKKLALLFAIALVASCLFAGMTMAQDAAPEATAEAAVAEGESAGESSVDSAESAGEEGESSDISSEDLQAIIQYIGSSEDSTAQDAQQAAEVMESTEAASDASDMLADSIMQMLLDVYVNGGGAGDSTGDSTGESAGTAALEDGLYGKPWVDTMDAGNLPVEASEAVDDLLLHYAYDILKEHQDGSSYNGLTATAGEVQDFMTAYANDEANDSHDIQQFRIFYDQAADFAALKEAGLSELQPYLDMVAGAASIEELNAVLTSEDFPFNPWVYFFVGAFAQDREENNYILISPRYLFVDLLGEESLSNSDDIEVQTSRSTMLLTKALPVTDVLVALDVPSEATSAAVMAMLNLEKDYGKYCNLNDVKYQEFGAYADSVVVYTLEELEEVSPNFPITDILTRFGKEKAAGYAIQCPEWITSLDGLWIEDNLDLLKKIIQVKIVMECQNLLDPDIFQVSRAALKMPDPEPGKRAYEACDSLDTFSQIIAKTYVEEYLGQETVNRLTKMTQGLIDTYKTMVASATWMGEDSKQKTLDKLENMKLNILYPDGGYFNYDNLELIPAEEGGTLIGNYLKLKEYKNLCENELLDQKARCANSWFSFSPTITNAFYAEFDNSINIIPGIATSNAYSKDMTDSEMLGGIGYIVGHEISHAFDFKGSQMDQYGRPGSIYTDEDLDGFLKICDDLAAYYDTVEYMDGKYVDGKRVNVEAAADLSGMQVILAYAKTLPEYDLKKLFDRAANIFVTVGPAGTASTYVAVDNHPLGYLRVNINAQMFDEFYETYGCEEGDGMYLAPENRIRFWGE